MGGITARGSCYSSRGYGYFRLQLIHRSECHSAGDLFADDVIGVDELGGDTEERGLKLGLISYDSPLEVARSS